MNRIIRTLGSALAALALCSTATHAADTAEGDESPYVAKISHATYDVDRDGRTVQDVVHRVQVRQPRAVENGKNFSISFSTSIQSGEVLEAYTLKQDGRKVPVPAGNYQRTTNEGRNQAGPFYSDRTTISVVFPDLAVGDATHVHYRLAEKEPMFPGQFSLALQYSPFTVYEDVRITVRAPKEMPLRHEQHHVAFTESEQDGKRVMEWRYGNQKARERRDDDNGLWSLSEMPSVLVSTFPTYEAIAQAYGARAQPKAEPTPPIKALAASIVGSETQPREKARKLYEWVSTNITYAGNCIGVGAVVPRDLDVVLANRMGDCKDHATLLQALLSASGIASEQVLVNAGGEYELADTPVVSMVNHVFNYLPTLKLYADATAKEVPFGYLPRGTYAKPVIHVGAAKALARVPDADHANNRQQLDLKLKITDKGTASGRMQVKVKGPDAAATRSYLRELKGQEKREFVKNTLESWGLRGSGTLQHGAVEGLGDEVDYAITFEVENYLRNAGATGVLYVGPMMGTPLPVTNFASIEDGPAPKRRVTCSGFHSVESYEVELPANITLLSLPDNADLKGRYVDYKASYKRTGNKLAIRRSLDDKTPGGVCSAEVFADFLKQAQPVGENLRSQILYKRKR